MAKVIYIEFNGTEHVLDVQPGMSVMQGALYNDVSGIVALCGGACACATCQIYVEETWLERVGPRTKQEETMLEGTTNCRPNSRLACEIQVTEALDGLVVRIPESQD